MMNRHTDTVFVNADPKTNYYSRYVRAAGGRSVMTHAVRSDRSLTQAEIEQFRNSPDTFLAPPERRSGTDRRRKT